MGDLPPEIPSVPAAARAAVLKALMDRIKTAYDEARAEADDELRKLYAHASATAMDVRVEGIGKVAKLSLRKEDAKVAISEDGLLWWVKRRHPDQIRERVVKTEFVPSEFAKQLLDDLVLDEETDTLSLRETGEVVTWARIVPAGRGTVSMTFEKGGRDRIAAAWQNGDLLPQLMLESAPLDEAGPDDAFQNAGEGGPR